MKIEKIGRLFIVKGRAYGHYFTAIGNTASEAVEKLAQEIAIIRSVNAWK